MSSSFIQFISWPIYLLTLCATLAWSQDCPCGLPGTPVKFKDCDKRSATWREHNHPDIGLTGSCLPEVPVK